MALTATEEAQARQLIAQQAALLSLAGNEATITSKLGAAKVNLGQLPVVSALADADLLLVRQGTTDKSVASSVAKTYIGTGKANSGANADITSMTALTAPTVAANPVRAVDIQAQTVTAFTTGGTSTAFTLTPTPASAANTANQRFRVKFNAAAGTTPTLAVSGLAALALKYRDSTGAKQAITATQVPINWASDVVNDGTDWVVENVAILPGVTTNSDASTGYVGEYQTAQRLSSAAISLTTGTSATVTNLSLTAGDWDVWGQVGFITATGSTSVVRVIAETSTGTSYSGSDGAGVAALVYPGGAALNSAGNGSVTINTGVRRFSLAATTQVNLLTYSDFTVAGLSAFGSIYARRVR